LAATKLKGAGIISLPMAEVLKEMKGFTNILVHEYTRIDDKMVYQVAQTRLADFEAFKQQEVQYLRHLNEQQPFLRFRWQPNQSRRANTCFFLE